MHAPDVIAPVVDADWVIAQEASGRSLIVADVRWYLDGRSGRAAYDAGHIADAVFVDLDRDLAAAPAGTDGRHPLPHPDKFAESMGALGIAEHSTIVAYDDNGGSMAARLVWLWRSLGRPAALLDGGLQAWPLPLVALPTSRPAVGCRTTPWPTGRLVDANGAAGLAGDPLATWLDARSADRFRGDPNPIDQRPGHIPGAVSAPWQGNLDPSTNRFLPPAQLRIRYEALGVVDGNEVGVSCGSGVTACHTLLALELAGFAPAVLYPASWSGWSADPDRPIATGE